MATTNRPALEIHDFAQIRDATIELGDLTVLVGPQATGKSLALQLLKLCVDGQRITRALADNGLPAFALDTVRAWIGDGPDALIARALDALVSRTRRIALALTISFWR